MSFVEKLDHLLSDVLPNLTKEEANFIESICEWESEQRSAFMMAKKLFEENMDKKLKEKKQPVKTMDKMVKNDKKIDKKMGKKC